MTLIRWTAVLVLVGCVEAPMSGEGIPGPQGPRGEPAAIAHSGSRLKARLAVSDDGASEFLGWWDAELAVPCDFAHARRDAMAGPAHCLPMALGGSDFFADDDCTVRVAQGNSGVTGRDFRHCILRDAEAVDHWHPLGARVTDLFRKNGDACESSSALGGAVSYRCGDAPEIAVETFAVFREQTPE